MKKERQTIFGEKIKNASKNNKQISRHKTKLVANECLNLTDREIRAINPSRQSTTTSTYVDESNTNTAN